MENLKPVLIGACFVIGAKLLVRDFPARSRRLEFFVVVLRISDVGKSVGRFRKPLSNPSQSVLLPFEEIKFLPVALVLYPKFISKLVYSSFDGCLVTTWINPPAKSPGSSAVADL